MRFTPNIPPRTYEVGFELKRLISDCGRMELAPDEQITFVTEEGLQYDVTRKSWGFYATPSLNGRLARFHLKPVMVKNRTGRFFILLVEAGKEADFNRYVEEEKLEIICWMDTTEALDKIEYGLKGSV